MALDLLNATDRFLGEARAISAERRKAQLERALQQEVAALFLRQGDMFLRKFAKLREVWPVQESATFAPPYTPPSWEAFWRDVSDATKDPFENALNKVIEIAMTIGGESLANAGMGVAFDLRHPYAERYLWEHGAVNVTNINKTTEDYIRTVVARGAEEGWSYDRVARAITDRFAEFAEGRPQQHIDSRAHLVAVTEVGMAYEAGNRTVANSLSEMGLQMEKSWLTAGDDRVSDGCLENEAEEWIPIDQPFPSGHQQPLRFPGCRCAALYRRRPGPVSTRQTYRSPDRAVTEMPGEFASWANSLSLSQSRSLREYQGLGYRSINDHLRLGKDAESAVLKNIELIDQSISLGEVAENTIAFRGSGATWLGDPSKLIGATIKDNGFLSVTINEEEAHWFALAAFNKDESAAIWEIRIPQGTRAAYMDAIHSKGEKELLLARGTTLRIVKVTGEPLESSAGGTVLGDILRIIAEVLP